MNGKPFSDTLWIVSLFIGVAQVLPQLCLIAAFLVAMTFSVMFQCPVIVDKIGDFLLQAVGVRSLVIVIWLLHRVLVESHVDMNGKPFFGDFTSAWVYSK